MKKVALTVVLTGLMMGAYAAINLNIDVPYQTVTPPNSGTIQVLFTGTVDILLPTYHVSFATLDFPHALGGGSLSVDFDPAFNNYIFQAAPGADYSGNLFSVDVPAATPPGDYFFTSGGTLTQMVVAASDGQHTASDNEFFGVTVQPVPEPATLAGLTLGVLTIVHRRRQRS